MLPKHSSASRLFTSATSRACAFWHHEGHPSTWLCSGVASRACPLGVTKSLLGGQLIVAGPVLAQERQQETRTSGVSSLLDRPAVAILVSRSADSNPSLTACWMPSSPATKSTRSDGQSLPSPELAAVSTHADPVAAGAAHCPKSTYGKMLDRSHAACSAVALSSRPCRHLASAGPATMAN